MIQIYKFIILLQTIFFLSIYTIHQTQNKVKKNLKKILKNFRGSNRTSVRITTPNKEEIYEILGNLQ